MLFNTLYARAAILSDAYTLAEKDITKFPESLKILNTDKLYCKGLGVLINKRARSTFTNVSEDEAVVQAQNHLKDRFDAILEMKGLKRQAENDVSVSNPAKKARVE